jgi:hypothetical protein
MSLISYLGTAKLIYTAAITCRVADWLVSWTRSQCFSHIQVTFYYLQL